MTAQIASGVWLPTSKAVTAMANEVRTVFTGDDSDLVKAFGNVGDEARGMAKDVDKATRDTSDSFGGLDSAVGESEGKFRGFGDLVGGTGDVMEGFRSGNLQQMAMGFADLAGGIGSLVIPALTALRTTILTSVVPAMWAIVSNPLFLAIAAGGAIIAGLFLLEQKFGIVSGAVNFVKDALLDLFHWVTGNWPLLANILTMPFLGAFRLISLAWNSTIGGFGFSIPDFVPVIGGNSFNFPKMPTFTFHEGGRVPGAAGQEVMAILQAGETVTSLGGQQGKGGGMTVVVNVAGSVITERDLGRVIADALRQNRLVGIS